MFMFDFCDVKKSFNHFIMRSLQKEQNTGTPALMRFFGPWINRVKGTQRYTRSLLYYSALS